MQASKQTRRFQAKSPITRDAEPRRVEIERQQIGDGSCAPKRPRRGWTIRFRVPARTCFSGPQAIWVARAGRRRRRSASGPAAGRPAPSGSQPISAKAMRAAPEAKDQQQRRAESEIARRKIARLLAASAGAPPAGDPPIRQTRPASRSNAGQDAAPAEPGHEQQAAQARQQPAGGQRMHAAREALARDHVMDVMEIGAGQAAKPRQPVDLRGPAGGPAPDIEKDRAERG